MQISDNFEIIIWMPTFVLRKQNTVECSICTEPIALYGLIKPIWTCYNSCKSIFHLSCVSSWAIAAIGHTVQFTCPNCRCSAYNHEAVLTGDLRCFCGRTVISMPKKDNESASRKVRNKSTQKIAAASLNCGGPCQTSRGCGHPCPLLCHSGPCPPCSFMGEIEPCATGPPLHAAVRQRRCGAKKEAWFCDEPCPRIFSSCYTQTHRCEYERCHAVCEPCPKSIALTCACGSLTLTPALRCHELNQRLSSSDVLSCGKPCTQNCILICHPPSIPCRLPSSNGALEVSSDTEDICAYLPMHGHTKRCGCGKSELNNVTCVTTSFEDSLGMYVRRISVADLSCESICTKTFESCRRHKCMQRCCKATDHLQCVQVCNQKLACGRHLCMQNCHPTTVCQPCTIPSYLDGWQCSCGTLQVLGPLPCRWEPPRCMQPCLRPRNCPHSVMHHCYYHETSEDCPPCFALSYPQCSCGRTAPFMIPCCYAQSTLQAGCGLRCTKKLPCGHPCSARCHEGKSCPPCNQPCPDSALCGHRCTLLCSHPMATPQSQIIESQLASVHISDNELNDTPTWSNQQLERIHECGMLVETECICGKIRGTTRCTGEADIVPRLPCSDACLHAQRFGSFIEAEEKDNDDLKMALEVWGPVILQIYSWASTRLSYVRMLEDLFNSYISNNQRHWVDLPPAGSIKRSMTMKIAERYQLQAIELDSALRGSVQFGLRDDKVLPVIPPILLSTVVTTFSFYTIRTHLALNNVSSDENLLCSSDAQSLDRDHSPNEDGEYENKPEEMEEGWVVVGRNTPKI